VAWFLDDATGPTEGLPDSQGRLGQQGDLWRTIMGVKYDFDVSLMQGGTNPRTKEDIYRLILTTEFMRTTDPSEGALVTAARRRLPGKKLHVLCPITIRTQGGLPRIYETYTEWLMLRLGDDYYLLVLSTKKEKSSVLYSSVVEIQKNPWIDVGNNNKLTVRDMARFMVDKLSPKVVADAAQGDDGADDDDTPDLGPVQAPIARFPNATGNPVSINYGGIDYQVFIN
jgi:hypothetical protein